MSAEKNNQEEKIEKELCWKEIHQRLEYITKKANIRSRTAGTNNIRQTETRVKRYQQE